MISVVIPALNAAARFEAALDTLVGAAVAGLVKEVIVVDGGSTDETLAIADRFGAKILKAPPGRGGQMKAGAEAARGDWLLFLHADTALEERWSAEAESFTKGFPDCAGVFTLTFDAQGLAPKLVAGGAMLRTKLLKSPYGDQGLLISKKVYEEAGGFADIPLMEDVDFIRRFVRLKGRSALKVLKSKAVTSAERYERDGYLRRVCKNAVTLMRYNFGATPEELAKAYR